MKYLLCTSTIIEGVNTSAKNVIIYDKKIGNQKPFDLFTFNNIKGRAGRMKEHFVGHVFVLNYEPQAELPLVDVPAFTQPDDAPESLLIQIERKDLSEHSLERLKHLYGQDVLPVEVMRSNSGLDPTQQLDLAIKIISNIEKYHAELSWSGLPSLQQLHTVCTLIFDYLMAGKARDGIGSANHLYMKIKTLAKQKTLPALVSSELAYNKNSTPSEALETVLKFMRRWGEYHFPRYLMNLDRIQKSVFEGAGMTPGDYSVFGSSVKRLFMPLSATVLEEYGVPFQVTLQIEKSKPLGDEVDDILKSLKEIDVSSIGLRPIEVEMVVDTIENL